MKPIYEALGISQKVYDEITERLPRLLIESLGEKTPNEIKAATIKKVLGSRIDQHEPNVYALIGLMVEQAYNAAVLQSQAKKPLFGKKR
jgi:selenophosphate synthase